MANWRQRIANWWQETRLLIGVLSLVRFQLIVVAVGFFLVLYVDQVRDIILAYGLALDAKPSWPTAWLLMTMLGCALVLWYTARVMLRFRFEKSAVAIDDGLLRSPSDADTWPRLKALLPRALGAMVFVIFLTGLASLWRHYPFKPLRLGLAVTALLLVYVIFVQYRRRWLGIADDSAQSGGNLTEFSDLPLATRRWYYFLLAANVIVMLIAINAPHAMAGVIGPGAVLLLGASLIVVVGSTLVYWSNWFRFPVVIAAVVLLAVFSLNNENHQVRTVAGNAPAPAYERNIVAALDDWVRVRREDGPLLPLFIVATEGGGIRAAYWTAAVLGELQDRSPAETPFGHYLFALSGVSGGSLGGAVFAGLWRGGGSDFVARSSAVLSHDFLGPTLTTLMFPDLLQRFLPIAVFDDRGMTLEVAWERAWREHEAGDVFAAPFQLLWDGAQSDVPLLFLNSTIVETGERMIHAPVTFDDGGRSVFTGAIEGSAMLGGAPPLSTVVHNSARFPYFSPAGLVRRHDAGAGDRREHWARLVDGGYFDNSGAMTAAELLQVVLRHKDALAERYGVRVMPYVIRITNAGADEEDPCEFFAADPLHLERDRVCRKRRALPEALSPLYAVLNVRRAHTRRAAALLRPTSRGVGYKEFGLRDNGVVHPLGWMLAAPSQRDMRCQVTGYDAPSCAHTDAQGKDSVQPDILEVIAFLRSATSHAF